MKRLNDIPKKDNFKAPDGYFDTLPDKLRESIEHRKEADVKPSFFTVLKPYLYFAGFFVALAMIIKLGLNTFTGDYHNQTILAEETTMDDSDYFEYELISEELIYQELETEEIQTTEIPEETMIAYLTQDEFTEILYYE